MICEHRVLTTAQVTQLAFGTGRAATARLTTLYRYRAVDRFRPLAARRVVPAALHPGRGRRDAARRRGRHHRRRPRLPPRPVHGDRPVCPARPRHRGERDLHRAGRRRPRQQRPAALECWWGERRCAAAWGDLARPDGYGRWSEQLPGQPPAVVDFFLEYDTGTEPLTPGRPPSSPGTPTSPPAPASPPPSCSGCRARAGRPRCATGWPARRRPASATPPRPRRSPASRSRPPPPAPAPTARPGRPGCPPAAPARGCGSPSSPRPAPPRPGGQPRPDGEAPGGPPGGLAWHPPDPAPPAWNAAARRAPPRPGRR